MAACPRMILANIAVATRNKVLAVFVTRRSHGWVCSVVVRSAVERLVGDTVTLRRIIRER